ncbi:hypothetical protein AX774_g7458 [Zancudomyces culisetae]|uniref:Uncharacterized protein n=1 Tax=Zancudomyces culisetae TaxID=1213189 RepID=A0A1R1PDZ8_ZANCU|nr:hypothetical protein AX774_g7458 [Zancudomyces culisetae]|eukprot:OMH79138.1 hypothetical protein AX774_g7458 [Zancudomyces culisetae]
MFSRYSRVNQKLGLGYQQDASQMIISADGDKHASLGKVYDVPVRIGRQVFNADLTIMERYDQSLILGTDWLIRSRQKST